VDELTTSVRTSSMEAEDREGLRVLGDRRAKKPVRSFDTQRDEGATKFIEGATQSAEKDE